MRDARELPAVDFPRLRRFLIRFIRALPDLYGSRNLVIGLSGGLDSAVAAFLAMEAAGKKNVRAAILPHRYGDPGERERAERFAENMRIPYEIIDVSPMVDDFLEVFKLGPYLSGHDEGDKKRIFARVARERMACLYHISHRERGLVLGTLNKTEYHLGSFSKHGDGAADAYPLFPLYKTWIHKLAEHIGMPDFILEAEPSSGHWPGETDEIKHGFRYQDADPLLFAMLDQGLSDEEMVKSGYDGHLIPIIRKKIRDSEWKRIAPPVPGLPEDVFTGSRRVRPASKSR